MPPVPSPAALASLAAALLAPQLLFGQTAATTSDSSAPSAILYRSVRITPVGFFSLETVYRQRALGSDLPSPFNAIPFPHSSAGHLSELRLSARHSRLGFLVEGTADRTRLTGYVESDFLSAGSSSNSSESNSYPLRLRQAWAQATFANGVTVTAGQTWSLVTPGRSGLAVRSEYVPATIDPQYAVGFDWARQAGLRVTTRLGAHAWSAVALEAPQTTFLAHGTADHPYLVGQSGGSTFNPLAQYSYDAGPDLIAKLAAEPGFGHYEVEAVGRVFRDRIYTDSGLVVKRARNYRTPAGGVGAAALWGFAGRRVELGLHALWGRGIGRYGTAQLPDATVRADGRIVPIRATHALGTLDLHPSRRLDLYVYGGVEQAARTATTSAAGLGVGYGSPLADNSACDTESPPTGPFAPGVPACSADTRALVQGIAGAWYRMYQGPHGTVQWGVQYGYTVRHSWSATARGISSEPRGDDRIAQLAFRYHLP